MSFRFLPPCCALVVFSAFLGTDQPGAQEPKLNSVLTKLPANTWVKLKPDRNPVGRSYSGVCYGGGLIYYFGGGHFSHPANDVELYDVAANTWIQATEPESFLDIDKWPHVSDEEKKLTKQSIGGGSSSAVRSPKGRPLTLHTYQMHAWFPEAKAFYTQIGGGLWAFDPARREWRHVSKHTFRRGDVHTQNLVYDPDQKALFTIVSASEDRGVHVYDARANTWTKKYPIPTTGWSEVYSTYDAARKVHVVHAGGKGWTFDLVTGKTKLIKDLAEAWKAAASQGKLASTESLSLEYDPATKTTLALLKSAEKGSAIEVWAYDFEQDNWSRVPMRGEPPRGIPNWDLLVYDPVHRCMLLVNVLSVGGGFKGGEVDGLFAFRYQPAAKAGPED